jgi:hypothetical protein
MVRSLRRFPLFCSAWLIAGLDSCTVSLRDSVAATRAAARGTYRLVSPYPATSSWRQVPLPDAALELTTDHACYHVGSTTLTADYDVTDDYVYLKSETDQLGFQRVGTDNLRQTDAIGTTTDYVRVY